MTPITRVHQISRHGECFKDIHLLLIYVVLACIDIAHHGKVLVIQSHLYVCIGYYLAKCRSQGVLGLLYRQSLYMHGFQERYIYRSVRINTVGVCILPCVRLIAHDGLGDSLIHCNQTVDNLIVHPNGIGHVFYRVVLRQVVALARLLQQTDHFVAVATAQAQQQWQEEQYV